MLDINDAAAGRFSPDGHWLAYADESRDECMSLPFLDPVPESLDFFVDGVSEVKYVQCLNLRFGLSSVAFASQSVLSLSTEPSTLAKVIGSWPENTRKVLGKQTEMRYNAPEGECRTPGGAVWREMMQ